MSALGDAASGTASLRCRAASSASTASASSPLSAAALARLTWPPQQKSSLRRRNTAVAPGNCTAIWPICCSALSGSGVVGAVACRVSMRAFMVVL